MRFLVQTLMALLLAAMTTIVPAQGGLSWASASGGENFAEAGAAGTAKTVPAQKRCRAGAGLLGCPFAAPAPLRQPGPVPAAVPASHEGIDIPAGRSVVAEAPPPKSVSD